MYRGDDHTLGDKIIDGRAMPLDIIMKDDIMYLLLEQVHIPGTAHDLRSANYDQFSAIGVRALT